MDNIISLNINWECISGQVATLQVDPHAIHRVGPHAIRRVGPRLTRHRGECNLHQIFDAHHDDARGAY